MTREEAGAQSFASSSLRRHAVVSDGGQVGAAMTGWRFVEQERLRVGAPLPEGCAVHPAEIPAFESVALDMISTLLVRIVAGHPGAFRVTDGASIYTRSALQLARVVEPVPAVPQKLGRLPRVGERFWVEFECEELDPGSSIPVRTSHGGWLQESLLGIDMLAKRSELAAARARVAELERELGGGE